MGIYTERKEGKGKEEKHQTGENAGNAISSEEIAKAVLISKEDAKRSMFFLNRIALELEPSPENVRWLTTGEAAQYLRVSISSLKTMIYRGQVRAHKLGRRNRFLRDELERLITLPCKQRR